MTPPGARSPALLGKPGSPGPALRRPEGASPSPSPRPGRSADPLSPRRTTRSTGQKMDPGPTGLSPVANSLDSLNGDNGQTAGREAEAENDHQ
ncbi:MAG: hypothetical protein BJ554DRAFT_4487 [Olpidium bornovanus]|uniref:Uncharacterized protein n=1 Tax=Olpidium bornovanus TaxID=278681 RepID=A0A8H8DL57_9FUNG|nr:MAG: hypothetical protein BJ554DRAFT_4487 [Olpidium bornovanus]